MNYKVERAAGLPSVGGLYNNQRLVAETSPPDFPHLLVSEAEDETREDISDDSVVWRTLTNYCARPMESFTVDSHSSTPIRRRLRSFEDSFTWKTTQQQTHHESMHKFNDIPEYKFLQ